MPPNQAQYHQPQQQAQAPTQQPATIYATQLSQASYGSNQVCQHSQIDSIKLQVMRLTKSIFLFFVYLLHSYYRIWHNIISQFMCRQAQIKA